MLMPRWMTCAAGTNQLEEIDMFELHIVPNTLER